ncbi:origin recognition complex subunit 3 isoform X1 [Bufo gargarizans]|uniref:origin recognition complex subunit 3 isoform X1 n=2 Tax=Bufo gargarizans TaxID=30331 RepID=UPI001CF42CB8|nr:origin recognition complex subunit 3 isoform X1 [Bufo gargarizans]XP_044148414.1 origin recognition complex subunit 3 isoform X1 [Bufo gargarizans]XP_044148415.1 origin recognition complex subunit 3 isoform X1 [Bufo gargarizans]
MTTSSVSKGCFVFKPSAKKKKLPLTAADYFVESLKNSEDGRIRFESCQFLWQQMKSQTEQLQEELNKKLFDNLISFLKKSHSDFQDRKNDWNCRVRSSEIPTAALLLGVNVTDHDLTFNMLSDVLNEHVTPYVVLLQAKECPGIKQLLQKLLSQLMGCGSELDLDEEDDHTPISQRKMNFSMASLSGWYQEMTKKAHSPKKKRPASLEHYQAPPIVVVFKDLESFTSSVLQEFIVISSRYCRELPLVLVFGIATSPMIIHRLMSHSVSSLLCIELFQSLSCTEHLATVVDKLLLSNQFPFKLSGRVLQVLITIFLYHDFSVHNFIKGLQLSVVEHFNAQPLSVLCCDLPDMKHRVKSLSHNQCENVRHLPSFMSFVESQTPEVQVKLLTDDNYLKEMTQKFLQSLQMYHENYTPVLRCLHHFTCILPKYPLGKQIRELYCACLEKNIWYTEEYKSALNLLRMLAKDELVATLQKCLEVLNPYSGRQLDSALKKLKELLAQFQCLEGDNLENVDNEESSTQKGLQKKTDLYQLQKTLLEMKETRRTKKHSRFESLRLEVVDFLDGLVRDYLTPPEEQPLYEVVYFSSATILRKHLNAVPRIALHTALNNPSTYLKSLENDGTLSSAAPDICIAYKLHLECGRLINLYDWLEAFATVVNADEDRDSDSLKQVDDMTHARFIRAVSELELLGFVKPTKQKTDHVARLTWGGC